MKKILLPLCLLAGVALTFSAHAATTMPADTGKAAAPAPDPPLVFSGSVDTYYKYDFSGRANIPTSFANEQNSISIGMIDLGLKKKIGKASFVGELSFGPRGQTQSIPNASPGFTSVNVTPINGTTVTGTGTGVAFSSYHIQNLYVSYDVTDKFNLTMGYMSTFVGYEVISPTGNFNDFWNVYQSNGRVNTFGAQLTVTPVKNWTAYVNLVTGAQSGTEIDLTTNYQITDAFKLGLNAANFSAPTGITGGFDGVALYPQLAVSKAVTLGIRGEYFETKAGTFFTSGPQPGQSVTAFTLTANIKAGPLTLIPEVRLDNSSKSNIFIDSSNAFTSSASQFVLAAVYAF
jgi:hypothetical protein